MQDSYNLGWKLGQVRLAGALRALLDTYEAERLPSRRHRAQRRNDSAAWKWDCFSPISLRHQLSLRQRW